MKALALLLALAACGKPYPTALPTPVTRGCVLTDTLWRSGDTVVVAKAYYSEGKCPKR